MPYVECKICKKSFYAKPRHLKIGWGKYCSKQCQNESQKTGQFLPCKICASIVWRSQKEIRKSVYKNFFCSKSCQTVWRNKTYIEERHSGWINGKSTYRNIIKRRNINQICSNCSLTDVRVLIVHHIDRNRTNNKVSNLIWLCRNCHYLIHEGKTF